MISLKVLARAWELHGAYLRRVLLESARQLRRKGGACATAFGELRNSAARALSVAVVIGGFAIQTAARAIPIGDFSWNEHTEEECAASLCGAFFSVGNFSNDPDLSLGVLGGSFFDVFVDLQTDAGLSSLSLGGEIAAGNSSQSIEDLFGLDVLSAGLRLTFRVPTLPGSVRLLDFDGNAVAALTAPGSLLIDYVIDEIVTVPEPSTLLLFAGGLIRNRISAQSAAAERDTTKIKDETQLARHVRNVAASFVSNLGHPSGSLPRTRILSLALLVCVAAFAAEVQYAYGGTLASVSPMGASPSVAVSITGTGFNATAANNVVTFTPASGSAVNATPTTVATLSAATGLRRLTVTVPAGLPIGTAALRVLNTPTGETSAGRSLEIVEIDLLQVRSAAVGASNVNVRITGSPNTAFVAGSHASDLRRRHQRSTARTVESATSLVANISVSPTAARRNSRRVRHQQHADRAARASVFR